MCNIVPDILYIVHNVWYNTQIPARKHDKLQYMLMRQKLGDGGEKVIGLYAKLQKL